MKKQIEFSNLSDLLFRIESLLKVCKGSLDFPDASLDDDRQNVLDIAIQLLPHDEIEVLEEEKKKMDN